MDQLSLQVKTNLIRGGDHRRRVVPVVIKLLAIRSRRHVGVEVDLTNDLDLTEVECDVEGPQTHLPSSLVQILETLSTCGAGDLDKLTCM